MSQDSLPSGASPTLEKSVEHAQRQLAELSRLQSSSRTQLVGVVVAIVLMFLVFMYTTYDKLRDNFNPDAIQQSMSARAVELAPQAGVRLRGAATNAMPTYRTLAMQRLQAISPDLARQAVDRFKKIPNSTGALMTERLNITFDNVIKRLEPDVTAAFPTLDKDTQHKMLLEFRDKMVAEENDNIKRHVSALYTAELVRLQDALDRFDHTVPMNADADTLSRNFLRGLIQYCDYLIVVGGEAHYKDSAAPTLIRTKSRPATNPSDTQGAQALAPRPEAPPAP